MTLDTFFLLLVPTYLVLIAYGQVGARKRRLASRMRLVTAAIRVVLPPVVLIGTLAWESDPGLLRAWLPVVIGMAVAGAIVAVAVEIVAPKIGA